MDGWSGAWARGGGGGARNARTSQVILLNRGPTCLPELPSV